MDELTRLLEIRARLTQLFYILLRDHMPAGQLEGLVQLHIEREPATQRAYSNTHLENYARELATRIIKGANSEA